MLIRIVLFVSLTAMAFFQIFSIAMGKSEIKPIVIESWMPVGWLKKNYKLCSGEYYNKHIKCEWVKKGEKYD